MYIYNDYTITPPDEPEPWWEDYKPSHEDTEKAEDMFKDFLYELADVLKMDTEDWEMEDYRTLFEMLI